MKTHAKRILLLMVGWSFILLGIAGLFLPILQGVLFLLIGLINSCEGSARSSPQSAARLIWLPKKLRPGCGASLGNNRNFLQPS